MRNMILAVLCGVGPALGLAGAALADATIDYCDPLVPAAVSNLYVSTGTAQFHFIFVTSTSSDATSTDIEVYNTFVNNVANSPGSLVAGRWNGWKVIGSTATVDARDNTGTVPTGAGQYPIYRLDKALFFNDYAEMWSGVYPHATPRVDEKGTNPATSGCPYLATGTGKYGTAAADLYLGIATSLYVAAVDIKWTDSWIYSSWGSKDGPLYFYGLSPLITVTGRRGLLVGGTVLIVR